MSLPGKTAEFVDHLENKFDLKTDERPELKHWSGLGTAIGAICLRLDLLDVEQLDTLLETQENEGGLFGQIAIRLGYLTEEQVDALLQIQEMNRRLELTQMLYVKNRIDVDQLKACLSEIVVTHESV